MPTSNSWDYNRTSGQIITAALEDLGAVTAGATVPSLLSAMALTRLNLIVKQYQGRSDGSPGLKIHTRQRVTLFLQEGQQTYLIGPASTDARATTRNGRTTIDVAEASGQTVLSVAATTDTTTEPGTTITMTAADIIGIELDDGTIHWTTIASVSAGDTVTVDDGIASAAAVGRYVWWFTSRAQRFPYIESAVLRNEDRNDIPLDIYTDTNQYDLGVPSKYADGTPSSILVEPLRITTRITLDSQPTDVTDTIVLTVYYPSEDYDGTGDDVAFPQEALMFLTMELEFALSRHVGVWTPQHEQARQEARTMYLNLNPENTTAYFQPGESG